MSAVSFLTTLYKDNKIVNFCTNATAVIGFVALMWQGGAWATGQIDEYFAKADEVAQLKTGQVAMTNEQKEQRGILERQGRQLDFIYYDSMKREKANLEREIFELRSRANRSGADNARLQQLVEDLRDLNRRIQEQEARIRGQRP
jgi:small-conductance mechanosensitive channel